MPGFPLSSSELALPVYGVIGNPIQHTKSPLIHQLFAEQVKQNLIYRPIEVEPHDLALALSDFQSQRGCGVNITSPFKQEAFTLIDQASERAVRAKAVNTIQFNEDGMRWGDNTDGVGLIRDIVFNQQFSIRHKQVLVLGAGGAVRGIVGAILDERPDRLVIANRTEKKAIALAEEFGDEGVIEGCSVSALTHTIFDLVINGVSAGLRSDRQVMPAITLNHGGYCYDMVYGQGMTPFLCWSQEMGAAHCSDGIGMLVEQAAESFYIWRGVRPNTQPVLLRIRAATIRERVFG